jgi:adenine-specific DNA-methyltransferase
VCNEIFGISNFRNTILTRRRVKSLNSQFSDNGLQTLNVGFEYVLVYSRSKQFLMKALRQKKAVAQVEGQWQGFWSNADRPTMRYDVLGFTPKTGQWRSSKDKADIAVANYKKYIEDPLVKKAKEELGKDPSFRLYEVKKPNFGNNYKNSVIENGPMMDLTTGKF